MAWGIAALAALLSPAPPALGWDRLEPGASAWRTSGRRAIRGVTVGPIEHGARAGRGYGTAYSAALLDELARMGVNWISLTPFGRLWSLRSTDIQMDFEAPYEDNREAVRTMVQQAHERGIRVLLIPHLWVETGGWRGEIDPGSDAGWRRYRESYRRFVVRWAADAELARADAFSIGVECRSWSGRFGPFWASFIAELRETFSGVLTYSANWDEAGDVLFWDLLDLIGINAFYPLADHPAATFQEYQEGARARVPELRELADTLGMPLLFVEVGYTTRTDAAVEPWLWPDGMADVRVDEHEQARALFAMLDAFVRQEWFAGLFIWRYYSDIDDTSQEAVWGFSPHAKVAETMLTDVFLSPWPADPDTSPWSLAVSRR